MNVLTLVFIICFGVAIGILIPILLAKRAGYFDR